MTTLHILSRVATPHNNALVGALRASGDLRVVTWYAVRSDANYGWKDELGAHPDTRYLEDWRAVVRLFGATVLQRDSVLLFVGYTENAYRILLLTCVLLRKKFLYWTDHPQEARGRPLARLWRAGAYSLVKAGAGKVLVVGTHTREWFLARGFAGDGVENFPIFVDVGPEIRAAEGRHDAVRRRLGVPADGFLLVAGSRLVRDKGFDVVLEGLALLRPNLRSRCRLVLVGRGPERGSLETRAETLNLGACVRFEDWMSAQEFELLVAAADLVVHPARFDAFGGSTLIAMAAGVPVLGSDRAGAVRERVVAGMNGDVFSAEDAADMARRLESLLDSSPERRAQLGAEARATAERWTPAIGARRLGELIHALHSP